MPLSAGDKLGPYVILAPIGAGGMGEVYLARDSRLERRVAIKILPSHLAPDPELRARFDREAKAISALQHPNICVLHDVGHEAGIDFLVMEYLEGETLAARLARKPLSIDEALSTSVQVAAALDAAHRNGVVHRDLKPGNVMLTKSGAKLMDFGLAKPYAQTATLPAFSADATMTSPASPITTAGTVVGTVQYMSPEQIQGQQTDARSDIFAFGATLYEMLTCKRAFDGKNQLSVASAILDKQPEPLKTLQPLTTPSLERLVAKCLAKDPEERWQSARDLADELRWIAAPENRTAPAEQRPVRRGMRELLYACLAVLFLLTTIFGIVLYLRSLKTPARAIVSSIPAPDNTRFAFGGVSGCAPVLSPDGQTLAFCALDDMGTSRLWVRPLDTTVARPLNEAGAAGDLFWSPDSHHIGFFAEDALKTIDLSGGPPFTVTYVSMESGGTWSGDGTIVFANGAGFFRVPGSGGTPAAMFSPDTSKTPYWGSPRLLPDGRHFFFWAGGGDASLQGTYFATLDGKERRLLVRDDATAAYGSGYLLDSRNGALLAQPFDPVQDHLTGSPLPVAPVVATAFSSASFDVSPTGLLVYESGNVSQKRLSWFDRTGKNLGAVGEIGDYYDLRLSPDGRKLAFNSGYPPGGLNSELWIHEIGRSVRMRLTIDTETDHGIPVWSPDGSHVAYAALQGKVRPGIYQKSANAAGGDELILATESPTQIWPTSWSHNGRFILYTRGNISLNSAELWILPLVGDRKPKLFIKSPSQAWDAQFSPDGRWVAYVSHESGRSEVYVTPFDSGKVLSKESEAANAGSGDKWLISTSGGQIPRWRGDGKEIFYLSSSNQLMAVSVTENGRNLEVGAAQPLFKSSTVASAFAPYDVTSDGAKFIINSQNELSNPLTLVVNWTALLKKK